MIARSLRTPQQLILRQPHVLHRVRRQEAILADEAGVRSLGRASGDGRQVGRLLGVPGDDDAPARIGHAMMSSCPAWMLSAGWSYRAPTWKTAGPLAGDDVEDLLHEDEALAGGEVRDPTTGHGKALGGGRGRVLRLRLWKASGVPHRLR